MVQEDVDVVLLSGGVIVRAIGAYRLASEVRDAGYSCQVIDFIAQFSNNEIHKVLSAVVGPNTKVLGISSTFIGHQDQIVPWTNCKYNHSVFNVDYDFLDYAIIVAKRINPNIKVVVGGEASVEVKAPNIDVCVLGPGERVFIEYLKFIEGKNPLLTYSTSETGHMILDGMIYNSQFDFIHSQTKFHWSDQLRFNEVLSIETSRGCIFSCKFCSYPFNGKKKNDYIKTPDTLKEEFIRNYNEYGTTKYIYTDDTHNESVTKLQQMADVAQSLPFKLEYVSYIRPDLLHAYPEQYQLLKDGGLIGCFFGIESLNPPTAKLIGKGLHPKKLIDTLYTFKEKLPSAATLGSFICGLPTETKESIAGWSEELLDPSFPLDFVKMGPLKLVKSFNRYYQSEFDKDSEKYFTWVDDNTWHNGDFDHTWALEFCDEFMVKSIPRNRIAGFACCMLENIGMLEVSRKNFQSHEEIEVQCRVYINSYKNSLLSQCCGK